MGNSETTDGTSSPATATDATKTAAYEPPAVAWEEAFDPVAQVTCDPLNDPRCQTGGT